ncbi:hypothetical protein ACTSKR_00135 [Chitinibacteraceae bacterium HSL-7]
MDRPHSPWSGGRSVPLFPVLCAAVLALPAAVMLVGWAFSDLPDLGLAGLLPALMLWMALVVFATRCQALTRLLPVLLAINVAGVLTLIA